MALSSQPLNDRNLAEIYLEIYDRILSTLAENRNLPNASLIEKFSQTYLDYLRLNLIQSLPKDKNKSSLLKDQLRLILTQNFVQDDNALQDNIKTVMDDINTGSNGLKLALEDLSPSDFIEQLTDKKTKYLVKNNQTVPSMQKTGGTFIVTTSKENQEARAIIDVLQQELDKFIEQENYEEAEDALRRLTTAFGKISLKTNEEKQNEREYKIFRAKNLKDLALQMTNMDQKFDYIKEAIAIMENLDPRTDQEQMNLISYYAHLGVFYEKTQALNKAVEQFHYVLECLNEIPETEDNKNLIANFKMGYNTRIFTLLKMMGNQALKAGRYDTAIEHFNEALTIEPSLISDKTAIDDCYRTLGKCLMKRADIHLGNQSFDQAIQDLREAISQQKSITSKNSKDTDDLFDANKMLRKAQRNKEESSVSTNPSFKNNNK